MVQTIAKTSEGWKQITETRGGWQSLTQGTNIGNQLVHDLPGALHNRGWAIGDTPHMPFLDRNKIKATETFLAKTKGTISKASWTSHALRDFMGISMKDNKLKVNTERHDTYFELLETLELLPEPGELREYWYMRLKEYERSNHIELEEMVTTMLELHKKEERKEKMRGKYSWQEGGSDDEGESDDEAAAWEKLVEDAMGDIDEDEEGAEGAGNMEKVDEMVQAGRVLG